MNPDSYRITPPPRKWTLRDAAYILAICSLAGGLFYERSARQSDVDRVSRQMEHHTETWQRVLESHAESHTMSDIKRDELIRDLRSRVNDLGNRLQDLDERKARH